MSRAFCGSGFSQSALAIKAFIGRKPDPQTPCNQVKSPDTINYNSNPLDEINQQN
jgi:hypothetical protein